MADRGLTLLELVAVLAIFSLVAVMGLQALSGMMRARDRLTDADEQAAALAR
ncbi:MAG: PulJ/GspJ family protein, partial [Roseovarius sp.]